MSNNTQTMQWVFFGTDEFAVTVLEQLHAADLLPQIIVTAPARKQGRGMQLIEPPVKLWADKNNIQTIQPEILNESFITELGSTWDLFVITSYGQIIRKNILDIPKHGVLNVHPSLLPLYRGASPIESAMLDDAKDTGVTIMQMDEKVDHGPIIAQELVHFDTWPKKPEVREKLATVGGTLLAAVIPQWVEGAIAPQEQDHDQATFTQKITKADGELDLSDDDYANFLKIQAYYPWPGTYFFEERDNKNVRLKITEAQYVDGRLHITKVIPEGKNEQQYSPKNQT